MAKTASECESSRYESVSAASLSGMSLSLATGIYQHHQTSQEQRGEGDGCRGGGEDDEGEGDGEDEDKQEIGKGAEVECGGRVCDGQDSVCVDGEPRHGNDTCISAKPPSASPHMSTSQDGIQCLLENVPQIKEEFEILSKIGEGTFSSVYLAGLRGRVEMQFALKHLVPTSASFRIENELKCLQSMGGRDNVIALLTCVRHRDHVVLIMPYFPHNRFTDYLHMMTPSEVQRYMRALFIALRNVHSHRVIHRDIKPSNFLYNRNSGRFQLVDFGLAHPEPGAAAIVSSSSSASSASRFQTVHSKVKIREKCTARPSTPPTSSSAHVTKAPITTSTRSPHPQVHINGTSLVPPQTYRRQVHQSQTTTLAMQRGGGVEVGRGKGGVVLGRRMVGRRVGEKGELEGDTRRKRETGEGSVCPLRHKKTELCDVCQNRSHQNAPRAGTPGFRAPEVLLKCPNQTTAVDVWSAGVILLCLLSGRYPFFRASDDLSALAQIIALMGTTECTRVAKELGKELVCGQQIEAIDLTELCRALRRTLHSHLRQSHKQQSSHSHGNNKHSTDTLPPSKKSRLADSGVASSVTAIPCRYELRSPQRRKSPRKRAQTSPRPSSKSVTGCSSSSTVPVGQSTSVSVSVCSKMNVREVIRSWESLPDSVFDLLYRCLELNPSKRITAQEALQHPFLADVDR